MAKVLVLNTGSSSIKFGLFDGDLQLISAGRVTEIGGASRFESDTGAAEVTANDHIAALEIVLRALEDADHPLGAIDGIAHRVVHGGETFSRTTLIDAQIEDAIETLIPLAPLHNPPALAAIRAVARLAPEMPQIAAFDTAFHSQNPDVARRYAVPQALTKRGITRYGFHGLSYASLVRQFGTVTGMPLPARVLAFHLGNGASLCAIQNGRSVATTMGYSPVSGLTMGSRSGEIDANAVLQIAEAHGIAEAARILNTGAGLLGLGGATDMRTLRATDDPDAAFAIDHFIYWATRHAGSMIAAMGGVDAIVFSGGIGENDPETRIGIMQDLAWIGLSPDAAANSAGGPRLSQARSRVSAWIIPTAEEQEIARDALALLC